jgi:hypothetical protein
MLLYLCSDNKHKRTELNKILVKASSYEAFSKFEYNEMKVLAITDVL